MKYHFEFVIPNGQTHVDLQMPTAPMYIEGDTYNGRCKVWLKYASLPEGDAKAFLGGLGNVGAGLELSAPTINRFTLNVDGGQATQEHKNNQRTMTRFSLPMNNETLIYDDFDLQYTFGGAIISTTNTGLVLGAYPFYQSVDTNGAGLFSIRDTIGLIARTAPGGATGGAVDLGADQEVPFHSLAPVTNIGNNSGLGTIIERGGANGTTAANTFPNLHFLDGRNAIFGNLDKRVSMKLSQQRPSDNADRGVAYCYDNKDLNDGNCLIIGSPWGSSLKASVYQKSQAANMGTNDLPFAIVGQARFEIVIEPMVNDDPVEVGV